VTPFGGINRRLSANPIAAGIPVANGPPRILDISACTLVEGKFRVALNKGVPVPDNRLHCPRHHEHTPARHVYGFHDLRKAFATLNADRLTPDAWRELIRHKSYSTTQRSYRPDRSTFAARVATVIQETRLAFLAYRPVMG
jgi:hypothetical protein